MELVRDVIYLVKSKGFSWKTYHEDESGLFEARDGELHILLNGPEEVPTLSSRMNEAIDVIRAKKPESIKDLATLLKEDYGNTNRLCHQMKALGLVDLESVDGKPKSKVKPVVPYQHLSTTVMTTDAFIAKRQSGKKKSA